METVPSTELARFFERRQSQLSPNVVYRAKTWGRFRSQDQLNFVDIGLLPLVEQQVGDSLGGLSERNVAALKSALGWANVDSNQGHWLLQTVFGIVSAKILRYKQVGSFARLELSDIQEVFRRLAAHYGTEPTPLGSNLQMAGLRAAADDIDKFASLTLTTTESLAHVYENTLISKETRAAFGTHRTPSFLVDYVVGNLIDWIAEIPLNERNVFEPACGQAAFLVAAMRLLTELLPAQDASPAKRRAYLRERIHGTDLDPFALELARLSLTLTDIPNPDGWDLKIQDVFASDGLPVRSRKSTILLANPPFGNFSSLEQKQYRDARSPVRFLNKSAELLWRTIPQLPEGGAFGVVLPQTILHSKDARELRKFLVEHCELKEVCLFPDKVFSFSDAESVVLIGRRKLPAAGRNTRFRRIREREIDQFRANYEAPNSRIVNQSRFAQDDTFSLRLRELEEVWSALAANPVLEEIAALGQGLTYHGEALPLGSPTLSVQYFSKAQAGFGRFNRDIQLHELPQSYWMNLDPVAIRYPRSGAVVGVPQIVLNYAPTSRGPWRLKALLDRQGHPVTSRFIAVRPKDNYSVETLWALLNSPVANAYAYSHLDKRDNTVGIFRNMPVPDAKEFDRVEHAASHYLSAASADTNPAELKGLLLRVDAEVLRLYALPQNIERQLLELFSGQERGGVPFEQTRYLPEELEGKVAFFDFLAWESDWPATNRERGMLIDKNIAGSLDVEETIRLDALQAYAAFHIEKFERYRDQLLDDLENRVFPGSQRKSGPR